MSHVSVIIPTFKRPEYLKRAIDSVISQTYADWELIVVDDGTPSDMSWKVVRQYLEKDARIRYIKQENAGVCEARNTGMRESKGKYVAFLDDDDQWLPEKLIRQVSFMESHPEIGLVYTRMQFMNSKNGRLVKSNTYPNNLATTFEQILMGDWIAISTAMIRRNCLTEMNRWFDLRYPIAQDYDLLLRFAQRWNIGALPDVLAFAIKDGRKQASSDPVKSSINTMEVLKNLELTEDYRHEKATIVKHIARIEYLLGLAYYENGQYFLAASHILKSLSLFPLVGVFFRSDGEDGLRILLKIARTYLAVPYCLFRGLIHGRR